jgi:hypothetical protein
MKMFGIGALLLCLGFVVGCENKPAAKPATPATKIDEAAGKLDEAADKVGEAADKVGEAAKSLKTPRK